MTDISNPTVAPEEEDVESPCALLQKYAMYLKNQQRRGARTVESYTDICNRLLEYLFAPDKIVDLQKNALIETCSQETLRAFFRDAGTALSPATHALWISAIRSFLKWLHGVSVLPKKLDKVLQRPRIPKKLGSIFFEEDLPLLLKELEKRPLEERLLFEFLYGMGLRLSEALSLKKDNLLLSQNSIRVFGKGRKWRQIPLTKGAKKLLGEILSTTSPGEQQSIWPRPLGPRMCRHWVTRWGRLAGFDESKGRLHPHKLRHSIASHLLRRGALLPQVQKLLGHKNLSTTERYTHLNTDDLVKAYDKAFPLRKK